MAVCERSSRYRWLLLTLGLLALATQAAAQGEDPSVARMRKDIFFLASDECEGRGVDTQGINKAADYIAAEFKKAGLKPGGKDGYFQPFTIRVGQSKVEGPATLTLKGPQGQVIELTAGKDFSVMGLSGSGKVTGA